MWGVASVFVYTAGKAANRHFERTIQNGIPLTTLQSLLPDAFYQRLAALYPEGDCFLWGDRGGEHGRQYWNRIEEGDLALCYRDRRIVAASTVVGTIENEAAGLAAWPDATSEPYRLLFFLTKPVWTDTPVASLPQYFGKSYQGLRRLPTSERILEDFGSFASFVRSGLMKVGLDDGDAEPPSGYDPEGGDRREVIQRQIRARRGQQQFRDALRSRFGDQCAVSGSRLAAILEAAHINPYRGDTDNHPDNGLLLRTDLHTLFDLNLLGIDSETLVVHLAEEVATEYGDFSGVTLRCPAGIRPSDAALRSRWQEFQLRHGR
jgi:hypothetical protein